MELLEPIILTIITAATPLLIAALGELVVERSGVLNLGVEGMMIIGAACAFAAAVTSGSSAVGLVVGIVSGAMLSVCFAFLVLSLATNQVATGLALTLLGLGLSGLIGESFTGIALDPIANWSIPILSDLPFVGKIIFAQNPIVYFSFFLLVAISWFLYKTRAGLILRAIGDNHTSAHTLGYSVIKVRYLAIMFGGACAGLAGAYLSLVYTPLWVKDMTAGRGWIALALVVFASWLPWRVLVGAYLFGGVTILQFHVQGAGIAIPSQLLSALPYLATIIVLVVISSDKNKTKSYTPACLGRNFIPDR